MTELGELLGDSVGRLFAANDSAATTCRDGSWPSALWHDLQEMGVPLIMVEEKRGGVGGCWEDAFSVLQLAGRHAIPLPLGEVILAAHLLNTADVPTRPGIYTVATQVAGEWKNGPRGARFTGTLTAVPWGRHADHIVCLGYDGPDAKLCVLPRDEARISAGSNLAAEPRDRLDFYDAPISIVPAPCVEPIKLFDFCAMTRVGQIAGCMTSALERTVQYAISRKQFGRSISQFQAIQQQLAVFASEVAAVACVGRAACRAADVGDATFQIAAAKLRANQAIGIASGIAHQVHGAIGFTKEYPLHIATQRLWSWRSEFGNDRYWSERLGATVARAGADRLWQDMTARDDAAG